MGMGNVSESSFSPKPKIALSAKLVARFVRLAPSMRWRSGVSQVQRKSALASFTLLMYLSQ
jgi:hypothetical protein